MEIKTKIWIIVYGLLLAGFSTYVLLDTFVIPRNYANVEQYESQEQKENEIYSEETSDSEAKITNSSYKDDNVSVIISTYREYNTNIYVADVIVNDASHLKTALADNTYGKNITAKTSEIADEHNAILAINGDFYGAQNDGYVIRNSVLYRSDVRDESQEDLVIYPDGKMEIVLESEKTAEELYNDGASQVLSFGPGLIKGGEIAVSKGDEVGKAMASNPRTAIAMIEPLHYILVVSDGRTEESEGLSLYELAEFLKDFNVQCAYNLDGGGSSTMYFNGNIINKPTTRGNRIKERSVSDIVYIQ